jgi:hypothetical protein
MIETRLIGVSSRPLGAVVLEPITRDNLSELTAGEWIWDDKIVERRSHKATLSDETIMEPIGFRQITILDLGLYPRWSSKPFRLSDVDGLDFETRCGWTYFEEGRFYRFK